MMQETDPTTGMAPLTEGSYWSVEKDGLKFQGQNIYRIVMVIAQKNKVTRLKWYGKPYTKTVIKHIRAFKTPIWNSDAGNRYESGYAPVITPAHLRKASFRALEEYREEVAKQKRLRSIEDNSAELLGDYPPKSLNGKENA